MERNRARDAPKAEDAPAVPPAVQGGEHAADERERKADERDTVADERERKADERDTVADEREHKADERDTVADEREHKADDRERHLDEWARRLGKDSVIRQRHALEAVARARALLDSSRDHLDRSNARLDRSEASLEREDRRTKWEQTEVDRLVAQSERDLDRQPNDSAS